MKWNVVSKDMNARRRVFLYPSSIFILLDKISGPFQFKPSASLFYMIWWYLACQQMYPTSTICDQWLAYYTSQSSKATHVCYRSFEITTNISEHRNKSVCLPTPTTSSHWSVSTAALSSWWLSSSYWAFGSKSINWFELFARCDMLTLPCFLMYSATAFISSVDM